MADDTGALRVLVLPMQLGVGAGVTKKLVAQGLTVVDATTSAADAVFVGASAWLSQRGGNCEHLRHQSPSTRPLVVVVWDIGGIDVTAACIQRYMDGRHTLGCIYEPYAHCQFPEQVKWTAQFKRWSAGGEVYLSDLASFRAILLDRRRVQRAAATPPAPVLPSPSAPPQLPTMTGAPVRPPDATTSDTALDAMHAALSQLDAARAIACNAVDRIINAPPPSGYVDGKDDRVMVSMDYLPAVSLDEDIMRKRVKNAAQEHHHAMCEYAAVGPVLRQLQKTVDVALSEAVIAASNLVAGIARAEEIRRDATAKQDKLDAAWRELEKIQRGLYNPARPSDAPDAASAHHTAMDTSGPAAAQECAICMDAPRTMAFVPCGHLYTCGPCASAISGGAAHGAPTCPICKAEIKSTLRVFS